MTSTGLPQNADAEAAVLGSMLIDNTRIEPVQLILPDPEAFYTKAHEEAYRAILAVRGRGEVVDLVTVSGELAKIGKLDGIGGTAFLAKLEASVLNPTSATSHARLVNDRYQHRKVFHLTTDFAEKAMNANGEANTLVTELESSIFAMSRGIRERAETLPIEKLTRNALERLERRRDVQGITGISTGFPEIDEKTGGFQPSDLIILAARPSMGKTALCLDIQRRIISEANPKHVLFFSCEMDADSLTERLLSSMTQIDLMRIRTGKVNDVEMANYGQAATRLAHCPIVIDDTAGLTIPAMKSKARKVASDCQGNLGLIVVDYLQLMTDNARKGGSRQEEVSAISRGLKEVGREMRVPVLALSQLSRKNEDREDKRPMLSDLRESGAIEQDADVVMFLHREAYYKAKKKKKSGGDDDEPFSASTAGSALEVAELIFAKQRNGPTGTVELIFRPKLASFSPMRFHRSN